MTPQQLDTIQAILNKNGFLPRQQAQRLIDEVRASLEKPKKRTKPQPENE